MKINRIIASGICVVCIMILFFACADYNNTVLEGRDDQVIINDSIKAEFPIENDLLYRKQEFSIGNLYESGVVTIDTNLFLQNVKKGDVIVIVFNDEFHKEMEILDEFMDIELEEAGYYGFFKKELSGEMHDISYAVHIGYFSENSILQLEVHKHDKEK